MAEQGEKSKPFVSSAIVALGESQTDAGGGCSRALEERMALFVSCRGSHKVLVCVGQNMSFPSALNQHH